MGVRFDNDEQRFVFDFEHDGAALIINDVKPKTGFSVTV